MERHNLLPFVAIFFSPQPVTTVMCFNCIQNPKSQGLTKHMGGNFTTRCSWSTQVAEQCSGNMLPLMPACCRFADLLFVYLCTPIKHRVIDFALPHLFFLYTHPKPFDCFPHSKVNTVVQQKCQEKRVLSPFRSISIVMTLNVTSCSQPSVLCTYTGWTWVLHAA